MDFSPEQLADARANIKRVTAQTIRAQQSDLDDMEQEIVMHLIEHEGSYTDHPPGYWASVYRNLLYSIKRRENAKKRGGGDVGKFLKDVDHAGEAPPNPLDAENVRDAVAHAPEEAQALARLLSSGTQRAAGQALSIGRAEIASLKRTLRSELHDFGSSDDERARPRADCVNEGKEPPHTEEP